MLPDPTPRLRFREMGPDDLDVVAALLMAPDPVPWGRRSYTRDDAARWIEWQQRTYAEHGFGLWITQTHDGEVVGDCGLTVQDVEGTPHVEIGYRVLPAARRQGYATEAARAVRDCAAAHGVGHLVALIRPANTPSQAVARNLGMQLERTAHVHGGDALVFGMRLDRGPSAPS